MCQMRLLNWPQKSNSLSVRPKPRWSGRKHVEMLGDGVEVVFPRNLGGAAELGGMEQQHAGLAGAFARLEIVGVHAVDVDVLAFGLHALLAALCFALGKSERCAMRG